MRLQLLHSHAVFKAWPTFQELTSPSFRSGGDAGLNGISAKIETYWLTKVKIGLIKYEDYGETLFLSPDVGLAVLVSTGEITDSGF